jgi:hypothetical protein
VLRCDVNGVLAGGEKAIVPIVIATHCGMTSDEFNQIVRDRIATAKHPVTGRLYTEMVDKPMLELVAYLQANDFKTFIVSGGGIDFMRPWTERVYGIPPENVVAAAARPSLSYGTASRHSYACRRSTSSTMDAANRMGINEHIGRLPIAAFGNSDGDLQMLQYTMGGSGARSALIVHHTDAEREWAYDRTSSIGRLDKALDEAQAKSWTVVNMKYDWETIFPFGNK